MSPSLNERSRQIDTTSQNPMNDPDFAQDTPSLDPPTFQLQASTPKPEESSEGETTQLATADGHAGAAAPPPEENSSDASLEDGTAPTPFQLKEETSPEKTEEKAPFQLQEAASEDSASGLSAPEEKTPFTAETNSSKEKNSGQRPNKTGMSDQLKEGLEALSGFDMSDVRVHFNSGKPAELGAYAYAQGTEIHLGPGQEKYLPHEAWHIVQQKQGRVKPTMVMKDGTEVNDDAGLEREADVMGGKAMKPGENRRNPNGRIETSSLETDATIQKRVFLKGKEQSIDVLKTWKNDLEWKEIEDAKTTEDKKNFINQNKALQSLGPPFSEIFRNLLETNKPFWFNSIFEIGQKIGQITQEYFIHSKNNDQNLEGPDFDELFERVFNFKGDWQRLIKAIKLIEEFNPVSKHIDSKYFEDPSLIAPIHVVSQEELIILANDGLKNTENLKGFHQPNLGRTYVTEDQEIGIGIEIHEILHALNNLQGENFIFKNYGRSFNEGLTEFIASQITEKSSAYLEERKSVLTVIEYTSITQEELIEWYLTGNVDKEKIYIEMIGLKDLLDIDSDLTEKALNEKELEDLHAFIKNVGLPILDDKNLFLK